MLFGIALFGLALKNRPVLMLISCRMPKDNPFDDAIKKVSAHYKADVILYIGKIDRPYDDELIHRIKNFRKKQKEKLPNVILVLTTLGGDPHAAYRMARFLQQEYQTTKDDKIGMPSQQGKAKGNFTLFVDTRCKSAGTILAAGANTLMISDFGELGPIDVQVRKGDEIGERSSVLTHQHAVEALQELALHQFAYLFRGLRFADEVELSFPTKLAAEVAKGISVGLFEPVFAQIDPMRVGEYDRAMKIALEYGKRLGKSNLSEKSLGRLVGSYPAHGFVIDKKEAKELFETVEEPNEDLIRLGEIARYWWVNDHLTADEPLILFLTTPEVLEEEANVPQPAPDQDAPGHAGNTEGEPQATGAAAD